MKINITNVKAFTRDSNLGNPATVIEGSINDSKTLKAIRHAKYSVSTIIDKEKGTPVPIRFFYENGKIETLECGHATLAAAHVLFKESSQITKGAFVNNKGTIITVTRDNNGRIAQKQPTPIFVNAICNVKEVADALTIESEELLNEIPIELVGSQNKLKLMIPLTKKGLYKVERNHIKIKALCDKVGATGLFPFTTDCTTVDAHARHFPNRDEEDLVCGVGALALAHYLKRYISPSKNLFTVNCGPTEKGMGIVTVDINENDSYILGYAIEEN